MLGEGEIAGPLAYEVESAGDGSTTGATRAGIVEAREKLLARLLVKALKEYPDQDCRPVWSYPQRCKLTSHWTLTRPGHSNSLTSAELTECASSMLCVPSPACMRKLGEKVGGRRVDMWGDNVLAEKAVDGDGRRKWHDAIKMRIQYLHRWAGVDLKCEVFNLFSGLIPQQGLNRMEKGRKRQGLVPDFLVRVPGTGAGGIQDTSLVLAELKTICSCPTRYERNPLPEDKAVERRAATLPREYNTKAATMDHKYGGVEAGVVGPVQAKLQSFPPLKKLVFGNWGEASTDVLEMVKYLASARLRHQQQLDGSGQGMRKRKGPISDKAQLTILTGQVRRELSLEAVRARAQCLLARLDGLGAGAAAAAKRRSWANFEEQRLRKERSAHLLSLSRDDLSSPGASSY